MANSAVAAVRARPGRGTRLAFNARTVISPNVVIPRILKRVKFEWISDRFQGPKGLICSSFSITFFVAHHHIQPSIIF